MSDEWGPWIEHDGQGAQHFEGAFVRAQAACGREEVGFLIGTLSVPAGHMHAWVWSSIPPWEWHDRIIRYRIRKPRALEQLREIARNPEVERARVLEEA